MKGDFLESAALALRSVRADPSSAEAWTDFYRLFYPRVFSVFVGLGVRSHPLIQDLTQEVFLRFIKSSPWAKDEWQSLPTPGRVLLYLKKIARNRWLDHLKDGRVHFEEELLHPEYLQAPVQFYPLDLSEYSLLLRHLKRGEQKLFSLRYIDELSLSEIADLTGTSSGAVATRLSRLRKKLRELGGWL